MWIALKLLASGAFDAVLRALSAALKWLLADWRNMAVAGLGAGCLWQGFVTVPGLREDLAETEQLLDDTQNAHLETITDFIDSSAEAQRQAEANVARVRAEQERITDATLVDLRADMHALRARFGRLRAGPARTNPGRADAAGLPGSGDAAGRAAATPADQDLPAAGDLTDQPDCPAHLVCLTIEEAEAASEDAHRHDRLIDWTILQSDVPFSTDIAQ